MTDHSRASAAAVSALKKRTERQGEAIEDLRRQMRDLKDLLQSFLLRLK